MDRLDTAVDRRESGSGSDPHDDRGRTRFDRRRDRPVVSTAPRAGMGRLVGILDCTPASYRLRTDLGFR